ncbi:hypothetical protein [Chryseobacterium sp.]|uniref:hypothetical protein n=1 Tax=Chryseobacterium sp. TaxID=1871047 RepID=UPI002FCB02EC
MITENVKNLFSFIDYLHSNKAYLLSKQDLIDETNGLLQKRSSIRPNDNYKSKIEYDKIQIEIAKKFDIVEAEIIFPLKDKIKELNVADISTPIVNILSSAELFALQRNFDEDDLKLIFEAKQKYLDFRNETNFDYYLSFFFFELDRTLKEFYDFFKDEDFNEFSKLQTNVVTVESLDEQGIEKAIRQLTGNSNELNFETFPEFLDYFKKKVKDLDFDERHSEVKRILEQQKIKLENSTFKSEFDEVKIFSENAVIDFRHKLMLSFTNENYKTKTVGFMPPHYNYVLGLIEYENLYNSAKNKSDFFNYLSTLSKEEIEEKKQNNQNLRRFLEIQFEYLKDKKISIKDIPDEIDGIAKIDLLIEHLFEGFQKSIEKGENVQKLLLIVDMLIQSNEVYLKNPLLNEQKKYTDYFIEKLNSIKLLLSNLPKENYTFFSDLLNNVFEDDFDFKILINHKRITINIIKEIREKLIELGDDKQRKGYLINVFRSFLSNGKDYHFYQISKMEYSFKDLPDEKKEYTDDEFTFLYNCLLNLRSIITDVSEETVIYGIDLLQLLNEWIGVTNGVDLTVPFTFYSLNTEMQNSESNSKATQNPANTENEKLTAKHYVLTYVFDCNAIGESLPHGNKKELERIGNERLGAGKGNTFYKNYNSIVSKDLNAEKTLIDEAGENWRQILLKLSKNPERLETYLQSKQM